MCTKVAVKHQSSSSSSSSIHRRDFLDVLDRWHFAPLRNKTRRIENDRRTITPPWTKNAFPPTTHPFPVCYNFLVYFAHLSRLGKRNGKNPNAFITESFVREIDQICIPYARLSPPPTSIIHRRVKLGTVRRLNYINIIPLARGTIF